MIYRAKKVSPVVHSRKRGSDRVHCTAVHLSQYDISVVWY